MLWFPTRGLLEGSLPAEVLVFYLDELPFIAMARTVHSFSSISPGTPELPNGQAEARGTMNLGSNSRKDLNEDLKSQREEATNQSEVKARGKFSSPLFGLAKSHGSYWCEREVSPFGQTKSDECEWKIWSLCVATLHSSYGPEENSNSHFTCFGRVADGLEDEELGQSQRSEEEGS
jgi:hypothetical protein